MKHFIGFLITASLLIGMNFLPLRADSVTSGSVGLLIVSTGVVDSSRNWGDKINSNFEIVASSMSDLISAGSAVALDTTTLSNATQIWNEEGSSLGGNATSVDCVGSNVSCTQSGSSITVTVTGASGSPDLSTQTFAFKVPNVTLSTITVDGLPGAYHTFYPSTVTVIAIWANAVRSSTVGWTRLDLVTSTGGLKGLPIAPNRFPLMALSTGSSLGLAGYTGFISSEVVIDANNWIGVQVSTYPQSGQITQGVEVKFDYFEHRRY